VYYLIWFLPRKFVNLTESEERLVNSCLGGFDVEDMIRERWIDVELLGEVLSMRAECVGGGNVGVEVELCTASE
jgi:hypothetical protein